MDGFKPVVKMKCGGSVSKAVAKCAGGRMKEGGSVEHDDIAQDKKMVKKAINLHDDQMHEGKKTDLSTLKKGGRCKKSGGTVRKYKAGGNVKKMADGGLGGALTNPQTQALVNADVLRRRKAAMAAAAGGMGGGLGAPNAVPSAAPQAPTTTPVGSPTMPDTGAQAPGPVMKRGGKVKKGCK